jgi:multidrug resistance protein, MATE family
VAMGLRTAAVLAGLAAALLWLARAPLAAVYASEPAVVAAAASLLAWVAIYHLADALQAVCVLVLRCYRITLAPLLVYSVWLWGMGLAGGYALAYRGLGPWPAMREPTAFWASSAAALAVVSLIFLVMVWRVTASHRRLRG